MKDVQNQNDTRGVEIQKVGIKDFEMPLVIQRKNTTATRNKDKPLMVLNLSVSLKKGQNIFSFLKPSKTNRSMYKVKRVLQSKESNLSGVGGETRREKRAANRDTTNTICFFKKELIFFIFYFSDLLET